MNAQTTICLFDKYNVSIPPHLNWNQDRINGKRALSISDSEGTFVISFEEGAQMKDMLPVKEGHPPTISFQYGKGYKYIHARRNFGGEVTHAYFHLELENKQFCTAFLPGVMTVTDKYKWSDENPEPVLIEMLDCISLCETEGGVGK